MAHHLHSLTALFDSPDAIVQAADETSRRGFTRFDVHTPYPVHGMDRAMRLKPSRMGFYALAFGLLGGISAVGLMTWITLVDYPLVIGGKPFWSWPAFVPVAFEVTVLLAAVLSVVAMIVLHFKFPNISHPLHDTQYMKRVSSDRFGLCIMADDPEFREQEVRDFLRKIGGQEISPVYFVPEELDHGQTLFDPKFMGVLALTAVVVVAGTYVTFNHLLYLEPFSWMMHQNKLKAQAPSDLFPDGIGMRKPVEGSVARGFLPYPYHGNPEAAGKYLVNPLPVSTQVLSKGKERFLTFCSPCHGNLGGGESRLRGQFPNPPTLHSDKVRNWPDGNLYHVITEGQNVMPGYAAQISRDDRWAVVHHIRVLQRAHNAKESDLR